MSEGTVCCLILLALLSPVCAQDSAVTEPAVSKKEAQVLKDAAKLAETDRPGAIAKLKTNMKDDYSAALDFALGVFLSQDGKNDESEKAFAAATKKFPTFQRAWASLGRIRLSLDKPRGASEALRKALKGRPNAADLTKLLAYSYLLSDQLAPAESAYRKLLITAPEDREVVLGLAKTLLAADRYRDALPLLDSQCRGNPMDSELWVLRANAHLALSEDDKALALLECAHRLGVAKAQALLALGNLYYNKGLHPSAVRFYDLASEKGTLSGDQILRCAEALLLAGRTDDSVRYLTLARRTGLAAPARAHLLEGQIAQLRNDAKAALTAYEKAVAADPLNGEAMTMLGEIYRQGKEYELAAMQFERASRVKGHEARALILLAQMEVEIDRFDDAVTHLETALEIKPDRNVQHYLEQVKNLSRY
ncbi:tetratricopeptide repeat protein [Planctomycetota bacterium]